MVWVNVPGYSTQISGSMTYLQRIDDYLTMVGLGYPGCSVEILAVYYVHNTAVRSELPCLRHARTASHCFPQFPQGTCTAINNSFINNMYNIKILRQSSELSEITNSHFVVDKQHF